MSDYPRRELTELVAGLGDWLAYQELLGLTALPGKMMTPEEILEMATGEASSPPSLSSLTLEEVRAELGDCQRCKLSRTRTQIVFGAVNPHARLVFVGEAPGQEEDQQGVPFVGAAGQLLDRLLAKLGLSRQELYITNIVKCRPPGNRDPEADEIAACLPFLKKQLQAIHPQIICTLGRIAAQTLLETAAPLNQLRGHWQTWQDIRVMPIYHPSYLLRFPAERKKTWEDMQKVMALYRPGHDVS